MTTPHTKEYHGTSPETGAGHHRRALVFSFSVDGYMRSLGEKSQLTSLKWWFRTSDILWNPVLHPDVVMFTTALLSHHCKSSLDSSTDDFYARTSSHPEWSKYPTWVMTDQEMSSSSKTCVITFTSGNHDMGSTWLLHPLPVQNILRRRPRFFTPSFVAQKLLSLVMLRQMTWCSERVKWLEPIKTVLIDIGLSPNGVVISIL